MAASRFVGKRISLSTSKRILVRQRNSFVELHRWRPPWGFPAKNAHRFFEWIMTGWFMPPGFRKGHHTDYQSFLMKFWNCSQELEFSDTIQKIKVVTKERGHLYLSTQTNPISSQSSGRLFWSNSLSFHWKFMALAWEAENLWCPKEESKASYQKEEDLNT